MRWGIAAFLAAVLLSPVSPHAQDITLVKHARRIAPPPGDTYVVKQGDTLRRILMEVYRARENDLPDLYARFRQLNPDIADLDSLMVGKSIKIPVNSVAGRERAPAGTPSGRLGVEEVSAEEYVVRQGEYLSKILKEIYGVPDDLVFSRYIEMVKRLNPQITDPNRILAGQKIRIPSVRQILADSKQGQGKNGRKAGPAGDEALAVDRENGGQDAGPRAGADQATGATNEKGRVARAKDVKGKLLPALEAMGGSSQGTGTYYVPVTGGAGMAIDTREIPVMELDTGKKIILDLEGKITPEVRSYIEKAFPSISVVSGPEADMESLIDRVLSVSGFFSVNKDPAPLMVGSEEKVSLFGKWLVYKDFSRRNVYVINLLGERDSKIPQPIRRYVQAFGIDIVEIGGVEPRVRTDRPMAPVSVSGSYRELFKALSIPFERDKEIELVSGGPVRIVYKAPVVSGSVIVADGSPDAQTASLLSKRSFQVFDGSRASPQEVLAGLGFTLEGPPVRLKVAQGKAELEIPAVKTGATMILLSRIDQVIQQYIASLGYRLIVW